MANSLVQGIAIGIIWVPLTLVHLRDHWRRPTWPRATAVFHLLRNIGSSFFISICVAEIVRATGANYSRMIEMVNSPYNTRAAAALGDGRLGHRHASPASPRLSKEINRQAAMLGYINAFAMYTIASALGAAARPDRPAPKEHPGARLRPA